MKKSQLLFALFLALGTWHSDQTAFAATADAIGGQCEVTWVQFGTTNVARIELERSGNNINGKGLWNLAVDGTWSGDKLDLKLVNSDKKTEATLNGAVQGDGLAGTMKLEDDEFHWSARRPATRPADAPHRHDFVPTQFHRYFAANIPPALKIWPGDTVHTETVDAGGTDKKGVK